MFRIKFLKEKRRKIKKPSFFYKELSKTASLHQLGQITGINSKVNQLHTFNGLSYMDIYEKYFRHLKESPINLLQNGGVRDGDSLKNLGEILF